MTAKVGRPKQTAAERKASAKARAEYKANWQREHPEKVKEYRDRHYAKKRGERDLNAEFKDLISTLNEEQQLAALEYLQALKDSTGEPAPAEENADSEPFDYAKYIQDIEDEKAKRRAERNNADKD